MSCSHWFDTHRCSYCQSCWLLAAGPWEHKHRAGVQLQVGALPTVTILLFFQKTVIKLYVAADKQKSRHSFHKTMPLERPSVSLLIWRVMNGWSCSV